MNLKPQYFLYARKSTEDDDRQVMSIEAQLFELREFAHKENIEILAEFTESKSAKTPGRPIFNKMMDEIEKIGGIGILSWAPDRLARNSIDGGRVIYDIDTKKLLSLRFATHWFEPTPQGLFMLQVAFGQSKYYSDNLSENIKRGIRQKLRRGEWPNKAPFGYRNNRELRNIEPHPVLSKIVVRAFKEYSTGTHSYESLAQFLAELGIVSKNQTPLAKWSIRRLLTHRAYLGLVRHGNEWFDGKHEPIITPALFEAVQRVLKTKERPRKRKVKHDFPLVGLFKCGECNSMFTAQWAVNRFGTKYRYYRCSKKRGRCGQGYIQEHELANQLSARLQSISLCDAYTDWMLAKVDIWERERKATSHSSILQLSESIKASEAKMEKLVGVYLDGDLPKEVYLKKKDKMMLASLALQDQLKAVEGGRLLWVEPLRQWILDTKQANFLAHSNNLYEIKAFVQKIGTNPIIRDRTARWSPPAPSQLVAQLRHRMPAPDPSLGQVSPLNFAEVSFCGGGEIRTLGALSDTQPFQGCALDRYATPPSLKLRRACPPRDSTLL